MIVIINDDDDEAMQRNINYKPNQNMHIFKS